MRPSRVPKVNKITLKTSFWRFCFYKLGQFKKCFVILRFFIGNHQSGCQGLENVVRFRYWDQSWVLKIVNRPHIVLLAAHCWVFNGVFSKNFFMRAFQIPPALSTHHPFRLNIARVFDLPNFQHSQSRPPCYKAWQFFSGDQHKYMLLR